MPDFITTYGEESYGVTAESLEEAIKQTAEAIGALVADVTGRQAAEGELEVADEQEPEDEADADAEDEDAEDSEDADEKGRSISGKELFEKMRANPPKGSPTNPAKAIRQYCLQCCKDKASEVALCTADGIQSKPQCMLYAFRFGRNPYRQKRELSEEQLTAVRERFKAHRK